MPQIPYMCIIELISISLQLLEQGLTHYTWKTTESADFIELASSLVGADLHRTLAIVQSNCQEMVDLAQSWSSGYLDVFACRDPNASYHMAKLLEWQRFVFSFISSKTFSRCGMLSHPCSDQGPISRLCLP